MLKFQGFSASVFWGLGVLVYHNRAKKGDYVNTPPHRDSEQMFDPPLPPRVPENRKKGVGKHGGSIQIINEDDKNVFDKGKIR